MTEQEPGKDPLLTALKSKKGQKFLEYGSFYVVSAVITRGLHYIL